MFKILGKPTGNLVEIAVEGTLSPRDFALLRDQVGPLIEDFGKARLLVDLSAMREFEGEGLWDASTFEAHESVERVAVVSPPGHADRAKSVFALGADTVRIFEPTHSESAWTWLTAPDAGE